MLLKNHFQQAYITHNLDEAVKLFDRQFGKLDWRVLSAILPMKTPIGAREASVRGALAWVGDLQLELIEPLSGYIDLFHTVTPADKSDATPHFHHVAVRRDDEGKMREEVAKLGLPLLFESRNDDLGLALIYVDATSVLGHYIEFVSGPQSAWDLFGWPEGKAVLP